VEAARAGGESVREQLARASDINAHRQQQKFAEYYVVLEPRPSLVLLSTMPENGVAVRREHPGRVTEGPPKPPALGDAPT